jgi:hypothetical protein
MCNHGGTRIPTEILWGNLKERDYKEDFAADERIILKWGLNRTQGRRLDLSGYDRYNLLAVMNKVMNFGVPKFWEFLD